jgi:hypothetical protein
MFQGALLAVCGARLDMPGTAGEVKVHQPSGERFSAMMAALNN